MPPLQTMAPKTLTRRDIPDKLMDYSPHLEEMHADLIPKPADDSHLAKRQGVIRVLIVGDSISAGYQGDWTWRYRIYDWFESQSVNVQFVGPYVGTLAPPPPSSPQPPPLYGATSTNSAGSASPINTGGYADNITWNSNHFAVWGRAAATDKSLIQNIVTTYTPDLILLLLGFNDIGWFYSDAQGTLDSVYTLMMNARTANPNIKMAIANIPMRSSLRAGRADLPIKTNEYNEALTRAIPQWNTTQSPIALVDLRGSYSCELTACPAGYDGLHPNAYGEYEIAHAFCVGLINGLGIGNSPLTIPISIPNRAALSQTPNNFMIQASPGGIHGTWDPVYGSYGYEMQSRIEGVTDWSVGSASTNRFDATWTVANFTYNYQIRTQYGDQYGPWTGILSAVANPQTAPGPINVNVQSTATGFDISWDPPTGSYTDTIIEYNIIFFDEDTPCDYLGAAAFTSSPAHIDGLVPGHRYLVAPATFNAAGGGFQKSSTLLGLV